MEKINLLLFLLIFISGQNFCEEIKVSDNLVITKLPGNVYIHTYDNSNGIIYVNDGEAVIASTPPSDEATEELIKWVEKELNVRVVGYIIDRWHPDAMEGLDVVKQYGIKSYSYELTRKIAKEKGLPVPDIGFDPQLELKVGGEKIVCRYFGPAHTEDGIVVWIPKEKVLFGGNEVRNYNGWGGNIGDANIKEWANTIEKVKQEYGEAEVVIPGHGKYGGSELLDYTIQLFTPSKWGNLLRKQNIERKPVFNDYGNIFEIAETDSVSEGKRFLKDTIVFIDDRDRYIKVESPLIIHKVEEKSISADYGRLQIFDQDEIDGSPTTDIYFKRLTIGLRDDAVGIVIIVKEMVY